jgi:hypothetical protein
MPELKALLARIPPELQDKLWTMDPKAFDKIQPGNPASLLEALRPSSPEAVTTFEKMNEKDEEMVFVCMRCVVLDQRSEHIVPGCVKKRCESCNEEVYMSPGTCYSHAMVKKPVIRCMECMQKMMEEENAKPV